MAEYKIGQIIELNDGRQAAVRFVGETAFAQGHWIGLELAEPTGKNNGSVQGERYFNCEPSHGMFVRASGIAHVLGEEESPPRAPPKANGAPKADGKTVRPRPSSTALEQPGRRASSRPTSLAEGSRLGGPGSGRSSPAKRPASTIAPKPRTSMAPPPARRQSVVPSPTPAPSTRPARPSISASSSNRTTDTGSPKPPPATSRLTGRPSLAPVKRPSPAPPGTSATSSAAARSQSEAVTSTTAGPRAPAKDDKERETLEAKVRALETKRMEDRDRLKKLDTIQAERDKFESIIQKLQTKYQPQQQENADLKQQIKEIGARLEQLESKDAEHDSLMEMATLDREMAEEQAEANKADLDAVRQRLEELELENEILREENEEFGKDVSPEERTSHGWLQLERENERLREALIRLRDLSEEREDQLRGQLKSLEEDVHELSGVKQQYDDTKARLLECEADTEDLRQQLEAALGAEEMIEELTERNETLTERNEELRATIDDLQSLKELNDELEINHIENEKQLQEVIDYKDTVVNEQNRRVAQQDEALADKDYTLSKFREVVTNLQADLEEMRASKENTETQAQQLNSRSRQMDDLNRQLQATASSTKVKTIDMELRKLEAQEAAEHLAIVQLFLPEAFHAERDSVLALLRFKRIAVKAKLLHGFIRDKVTNQSAPIADDDIFDACDAIDKLTWISAMCERFTNSIYTCSLEQFASYEGALYDLEPVERALNGHIENLKHDELKEHQVADQLHRSVAVMSHLGETHLGEGLEGLADDILMRALVMQSQLETTAAALTMLRSEVDAKVVIEEEDEENELEMERFGKRTESLVNNTRSAKVMVSKCVRALQELKARSLTLTNDTLPSFEEAASGTEELALFARKLGSAAFSLLHEEGRTSPFTPSEIRNIVLRTSSTVFTVQETDPFITMNSKLRKLTEQLVSLGSLAADLDNTIEFERSPAPWVLRSKELQASKIVSVDAEEEIRRLKEEVIARSTQLRIKEQEMDEAAVKVELLESRSKDASKKVEAIANLEKQLEQGAKERKRSTDLLVKQEKELEALRSERERWIDLSAAQNKAATDNAATSVEEGVGRNVATQREIDTLNQTITDLESANRYLRACNRRDQVTADAARNSWLHTPLKPMPDPRVKAAAERSRKVFAELTNLPNVATMVDLRKAYSAGEDGKGGKDRLKWRPKKESPAEQLWGQEIWKAQFWKAGDALSLLDNVEYTQLGTDGADGQEPGSRFGLHSVGVF